MFSPIARINVNPLLPKNMRFDSKTALVLLRKEMLRRIKANIRQEAFSARAKTRLFKAMSVRIGPKSVTVVANDPAFRALLEGRKRQQMTWLLKAKGPIPIVLDSGELIFRSVTPRSMENKGWFHPGKEPTTVIERARVEAKKVVKARILKILRQMILEGRR